jgi:branched-chain amino acid transport system permease protein
MDIFIQLTINGLLLGALYAAMTLGFSIVWGVMRLINLAHGEFIMLGAYIAWVLANPQRTEIGITIGQQNIPIHSILLILIWGSLGLILSRFVLRERVNHPILYRVLGYGISAVIVWVVFALWNAVGSPALDPMVSIPVAMLVTFGIGYVIQRGLFNRIIEAPYLTTLLIAFSVSIVMSNTVLRIFTANPLSIIVSYERGIHIAENITLSPVRVIVFVLSLIMVGAVALLLQRTRIGRSIRAAAQNKMAARLVGINVKETYAITFAIAVAVAAAAGAMSASFTTIVPFLGPSLTLRGFAVTALGGLGKIEGALIGGLVLGMVESYVGGDISAGWQIAAAFLVLVFFLIVRPQGLLGGLRTTAAELN